MRKLHLVGVTSDLKGLIFSGRRGSKSGGYLVNIEDELIDAITDARRGDDGDDVAHLKAALGAGDDERKRYRPESTLTPREIQARLRAGRSIAEVAGEASVGTEWVERFAVPILAEQAKVVELARGLKFSKPRLGESAAPLGKSVAQNLAGRGAMLPEDMFDAGWSAYQLHDSVWVVRFRYRSRGRLQEAAWDVDVDTGIVNHRNRLGSELGYVEGGRRRRSDGAAPSAATRARKTAAKGTRVSTRQAAKPAPAVKRKAAAGAPRGARAPRKATASRRTSTGPATKATKRRRSATKRPAAKRPAAAPPATLPAPPPAPVDKARPRSLGARATATHAPASLTRPNSVTRANALAPRARASSPGGNASLPKSNGSSPKPRGPSAKLDRPAAKANPTPRKTTLPASARVMDEASEYELEHRPASVAPVAEGRPVISAQPVSQLAREAGPRSSSKGPTGRGGTAKAQPSPVPAG